MQKILVHTCCGPCALMPLEKLIQNNFLPSAYFFNPNIHLQEEYLLRLYAMQEVTQHYDIPLIIQGNEKYFSNLKEENKNLNLSISKINRLALSYCTPFLCEQQWAQQDEQHESKIKNTKWTVALQKILKKWKKYTQEFSQFAYNTKENSQNTILAQSTKNSLIQNELHVDASLFIARIIHHTSHNLQNTQSQNLQIVSDDSPFLEGERCKKCYVERLYQSALYASQNGFELFTSTLLYSRYQNHEDICQAAYNAEEAINKSCKTNTHLNPIKFYYQDFRTLWQEGIDKSKELNLYRQKWCGCNLSRMESLERMTKRVYDKVST